MKLPQFLWNVVINKMSFKTLVLCFLCTFGISLGLSPRPEVILFFLLYHWGYFTVYVFNDLIDYEKDLKKKFVYESKALVKGYASPKDYQIMLGFSFLPFVISSILSTELTVLLTLAVLINNIRTLISDKIYRTLLLAVVEMINFGAFWWMLFGSFPHGTAARFLAGFSLLYASLHMVYKLDIQGLKDLVKLDYISAAMVITGLVIFSRAIVESGAFRYFPFLLELIVISFSPVAFMISSKKSLEVVYTNWTKKLPVIALVSAIIALAALVKSSPTAYHMIYNLADPQIFLNFREQIRKFVFEFL